MEGAYEISCPDAKCQTNGLLHLDEIEEIVGQEIMEKYKKFRINTGKIIN